MKALCIARKTVREMLREPMLLWLLLLFPASMIGFYKIAFGQTDAGLSSFLSVHVVNEDEGAERPDGTRWQAGAELVDALRAAEYEDRPVFDVRAVTDPRAAELAVREHKATLRLTIPAGFSRTLARASEGAVDTEPADIVLLADPGSDAYVFARSFLDGMVRGQTAQAMGWPPDLVTIRWDFLPGTGTMSDFDFGVGGIIAFGVMFLIITTASVMVREDVAGTLTRLRLSRAHARDVLLGVALAQLAISAVKVSLTFGTALALGFQNNGSLLLAMGIVLLLGVAAIGLGLVVACFARNDGEATNLASLVMVPMVFLSEALYPMPDAPVATIGGHTIQAYDFIPASSASEALRRVLVFGDGVADIAYELTMLAVMSGAILILGVVLYQRLKLRRVG